MKHLFKTLTILLLPFFVNAQTQVVPPAFETVDPGGSFLGPLANGQRTYMLLIHENQLTNLVGMELTGVTFRSSSATTSTWPASTADYTAYDIYLGQGVAPANRSLASISDNFVGTPTQVRSGALSIPANSFPAGGPSSFGPSITFTTPYPYSGGHLYLRVSHNGSTGTSRSVNAVAASGGPAGVYGTQVSAAWQGAYSPSGTLTNGNAAVIQFSYTTGVPVTSVSVATQGGVPASITTNGATLQMEATVLPSNAFQGVNWSIVPVTGMATISATGEITPVGNGTVWAKAVSAADATKMDSMLVTISDQIVPITDLTVSTQGSVPATITVSGGTLQMTATILPSYADQSVTWSIIPISGDATISSTGLVTGVDDGLVWARAISVADPTFRDSMQISLSNQNVPVTGLDVVTQGGVPAEITTNAGTLQLQADIIPANANNQNVTWSLTFGTGAGTISSTGLVTALSNGTVTAKANSVENNSINDSLIINISGQGVGVRTLKNNDKFEIFPNPTQDGQINIKFEAGFVNGQDIAFTIVDINGKVMQTGSITKDRSIIDISRLSAGNYFLNLNGDNIKAQRTVVKTK